MVERIEVNADTETEITTTFWLKILLQVETIQKTKMHWNALRRASLASCLIQILGSHVINFKCTPIGWFWNTPIRFLQMAGSLIFQLIRQYYNGVNNKSKISWMILLTILSRRHFYQKPKGQIHGSGKKPANSNLVQNFIRNNIFLSCNNIIVNAISFIVLIKRMLHKIQIDSNNKTVIKIQSKYEYITEYV